MVVSRLTRPPLPREPHLNVAEFWTPSARTGETTVLVLQFLATSWEAPPVSLLARLDAPTSA